MADKKQYEEIGLSGADKKAEDTLGSVMKPTAPPAGFEAKLKNEVFAEWDRINTSVDAVRTGAGRRLLFTWFRERSLITQFAVSAVILVFIAAIVIGTLNVPQDTPGLPPVNSDTQSEDIIEVKTGEQFVISLEENPGTGYLWKEVFDPAYLELVESYYEQPSSKTGAGGNHIFRFKTLKKGSPDISMELVRSPGEKALETRIFSVNID